MDDENVLFGLGINFKSVKNKLQEFYVVFLERSIYGIYNRGYAVIFTKSI